MPNINSLTYNGTKSTDLGVFVTGSGSFDAAELDVEKIEVPGRNGDVILPRNRFKNIEITYPAFIPKAFQNNAQNIRNWLRSAKTYARLEDTYDMAHYRLGLASGVQSFEPANRNDASNFEMVFDCKPQRFLKTGETESHVSPDAHEETGDLVSFDALAVEPIDKAEVALSPIQSLNGYDHPWAPGAGVNKCAFPSADFTLNGVHYYTQNGTLYISGTSQGETSSANSAFEALSFTLPAGTYYFSRFSFETASYLKKTSDNSNLATNNGSFTLTEATAVHVGFYVYNKTFSGAAIPLSITVGSTAPSAYTPTANLCPITGHTQATLNIGTEYPTPVNSFTLSLGQTVYGGKIDLVTGEGEITTASHTFDSTSGIYRNSANQFYISNAFDSNIKHPAAWESSLLSNKFKPASTTSEAGACFLNVGGNIRFNTVNSYATVADMIADIGAIQFTYPLETPIPLSLTGQQIQTLLGLNNIWSDAGEITIDYSDPFHVDNPTNCESRPLFRVVNPGQGDEISVNGQTIEFTTAYTGTIYIDCETMNAYAGYSNMNSYISATDFPVLTPGLNIVTYSGNGECYMTPRWWEL